MHSHPLPILVAIGAIGNFLAGFEYRRSGFPVGFAIQLLTLVIMMVVAVLFLWS